MLDVGQGSPLHDLMLHEGTEPLRTLYEEDFGQPVADLLLLKQPHRRRRRVTAEQRRLKRNMIAAAGTPLQHSDFGISSSQYQGIFVSY